MIFTYVKLASYKTKTLHYFNMARRRTKRVKTTPSLIIGVIAVAAVALLAFALLSKKAPFEIPGLTPLPTVSPEVPTPTPTPGLPVKKLPDTAGEPVFYTVAQNDSLYAIGMTFCDDKAAWVYLAEQNNLIEPYILHKGETLTLSCP